MKRFAFFVLTVLLIAAMTGGSRLRAVDEEQPGSGSEGSVMAITGTDDFGRKIDMISGTRKDRYVGLFYFIWFDFAQKGYRFDTTKLLRTKPDRLWDPFDKTGTAPSSCMYYFNEPLYGYYKSTDKWVVRKHIELFAAAGVDFLAIDLSNDVIYEPALTTLLDTLLEYQEAGISVPKIVCYTNLNTGHTVDLLYKVIYSTDKYRSLWFYGPYEKPLIVAHEEELKQEYLDFFYVRPAQWPGFEYEVYEDGFPFCDLNRPQRTHQNLIGVSVAQHTGYVFSYGMKIDPNDNPRDINHGRGYTSSKPENGNAQAIMRGDNIQEQWDYAISQDPEIVFVTGWNEWATNKWPGKEGDTVARFVDSFNTEFSRDIEMTKERRYVMNDDGTGYVQEGYGDNFYLQLVRNIRRYKGIAADGPSYIEPDTDGQNYISLAVVNEPRDCGGYKQAAAANFIRTVNVSHTPDEIVFKVGCADEITTPDDGALNWMNIFMGFEGSKEKQWQTYSYVLNRHPEGNVTWLEKYDGSGFVKSGECALEVSGSEMIVRVPLELIAELNGAYDFVMYFKVADSVEDPEDEMDYYVSGSSVPLGRLSYTYAGKIKDAPAGKKVNAAWIVAAASGVVAAGAVAAGCVVLSKERQGKERVKR
jgi:hypothetical protein